MEPFSSVCKTDFLISFYWSQLRIWFSEFLRSCLTFSVCIIGNRITKRMNELVCLHWGIFLQFIVVPTIRSYLNRKYIIISIERVCVCTLFIQDVVIFSFPSSKFRQVKRIQTIIFVIFLLCVNSSHIYII